MTEQKEQYTNGSELISATSHQKVTYRNKSTRSIKHLNFHSLPL